MTAFPARASLPRRDLVPALIRANAVVAALLRARAIIKVRARARSPLSRRFDEGHKLSGVDRTLDRARALAVDLHLVGIAVDLDRAHLDRARALAVYLDILVRARIRAFDVAVAIPLVLAARRAGALVRMLEKLVTPPVRMPVLASPVRVADRLASAATRVLPVTHRCRYRDEYRSELYELAAAETAKWRQVVYALRLLDRAWILRAELRAPAAGRARS